MSELCRTAENGVFSVVSRVNLSSVCKYVPDDQLLKVKVAYLDTVT